eukprot:Phypoly_transcript_00093.p1 GENE.Phypoly_transcript_00093~~Phypoly_transcript_00093.p1  ORF type:complete len:2228 (+),score=422.82 Phypoly_transcript_00093:105-6788(+)
MAPTSYELLQLLHSGTSTYVIRAKAADNKTYIIKENSRAVTSQKKLRKYFREYMLGSSIDSPYVVKYVDMKRFGYGFAIIMEDIGGISIKEAIPANGFSSDQFLQIAILIVKGLADVHAAGVIHRDINPHNIVVNLAQNLINIIDFDIASRLSKEDMNAIGTHQIQGTFLYMSPEQTGRMNRHIDYRSDFYSLGATFYEMLCGKPPFRPSIDPLELIHKHIAVAPKSLQEINGDIPKPLSDVILKLMAKNAEDRYQDCHGILADLMEIQERLKTNEKLDGYVVGGHDQPRHFQISQKLYGRDEQTEILTANFDRVSSGEIPIMLMLVHGYSGVGKTTLVNEVHKPLVRDKGYYVYGKFNQFAGNVPYAAFIQALKQLMQQLLSESEERLKNWRELLQSAVGKNGQVIVDVIPDFELVVGPQPPVTKLSAVDSQNRFKQLFIKFMATIASRDHPLVIFLDDLQWADPSTLSILSTLLLPSSSSASTSSTSILSASVSHLLILGAYRENEVSHDHAFVRMVDDLRARGGCVQDLMLQPLTLEDVNALVGDTCAVNRAGSETMKELCSSNAKIAEVHAHELALAKAIYKKTEGNPFFINQLLTMLYQDGHIYLQTKPVPHWECNMEQIEAANYTNNVVDLMVTKLRRTPEVQTVLGIAAQIGNQFELKLLTALCDLTPAQTLALLRIPIQENFIVAMDKEGDMVSEEGAPVSGNMILTSSNNDAYSSAHNSPSRDPAHEGSGSSSNSEKSALTLKFRFGHDRIQQASASLVALEEIPKIHFRIAEQLLSRFLNRPKLLDDVLLFLVGHLNQGIDLQNLEKPAQGAEDSFLPIQAGSAAKLNLMAATKSKNTNAFAQALIFIDFGLNILRKWDETSWHQFYELYFALHLLKAEVATLIGEFEKSEEIYPILLEKAKTNKDRCSVYLVMYYQYEVQNRYEEVIKCTQKGLAIYGVELPDINDEKSVREAYEKRVATVLKEIKKGSDVEKLMDLPFCTDEAVLSCMKLLQAMWMSTYVTGKQPLAALLSVILVTTTMEKGLCEESMMGFTAFGFNVGPYLKDYRLAYHFGKLAVTLSDLYYPQTIMRGHVYIVYSMYNLWCEPISFSFHYLLTGFELSLQTGDIAWATYVAPYFSEYLFFQGASLPEAMQQYTKYLPFLQSSGNKMWCQYALLGTQPIKDLIGDPDHFLEGASYHGSSFEQNSWLNVTAYYAMTTSAYYLQDKQNWLDFADHAIDLVPKLMPCLFKEYETRTTAPLIYLDWMSRSPLVRKLYGTKSQTAHSSPKLTHDNRDIEYEKHLSKEDQAERLHQRIDAIHECVDVLERGYKPNGNKTRRKSVIEKNYDIESERHLSYAEQLELVHKRLEYINECIGVLERLADSCECNFQHKLLLIKAECARVSLILGSTAIFNRSRKGNQMKIEVEKEGKKQDFEEAMELYEAAIQSARAHGFAQYEVLALELFALFWLTATSRPKEHVASGYLVEAIFVCERWGAPAKAQRIRSTYSAVLAAAGRYEFAASSRFPTNGNLNAKHQTITATQSMFSADLETVVQSSQAIANETDISRLIGTMIKVIVETSGAQRGSLFTTNESNQLLISGEYNGGGKSDKKGGGKREGGGEVEGKEGEREEEGESIVVYEDGRPFEDWVGPHTVVNFSRRTLKPILIPCANEDYQFGNDAYIVKNRVKSVLCMPIMVKNNLKGVLYLENNLFEGLFTKHRMDFLLVLTSQMAITLENTRFFNAQMKEQIAKLKLEQLMYDEERQRLRADAAEKYRLQLENFVDMICHEIRNPLNGILGNADLIFYHLECVEAMVVKLKETTKETATDVQLSFERELIDQIEHIKVSAGSVQICAEHQKCITDDVLQLSKLRANKLVLSNNFFLPSDLIFTVVRMFSVQAQNKGLILEQYFPEGDQYDGMQIWTDGMRITQIISNIVSNAVKFTHKGYVKITVGIEENLEKEREAVILHNNDEEVMGDWIASKDIDEITNEFGTEEVNGIPVQSCFLKVKIEDTGIGMTEDEQARIFTRFSQANNRTSKEYGGSGLGLAICKILAKQMGGYLYVESKKGEGSTFHLSVHCKRPSNLIRTSSGKLKPPTLPGNEPPKRRLSDENSEIGILVVEDNTMNQLLLNRILKIKGYKVHMANNGLEGFETYKTRALQNIPFHYILMDIQMPVMDGLESTIRIRNFEKEHESRPATIIGLSGNARDEYKEQALTAGMNYYITKPYHKEILFSLLK